MAGANEIWCKFKKHHFRRGCYYTNSNKNSSWRWWAGHDCRSTVAGRWHFNLADSAIFRIPFARLLKTVLQTEADFYCILQRGQLLLNASVSSAWAGILHVVAVSPLISVPLKQWDYKLATGSFHYNLTSCRTLLEHVSVQLVVKNHRWFLNQLLETIFGKLCSLLVLSPPWRLYLHA